MLGVITGTFGGVMGDVICNRVPSLFRPAPLYATCSFAGCWVYFLMRSLSIDDSYAAAIGAFGIVSSRLAAIKWNLRMPALGVHDPGETIDG